MRGNFRARWERAHCRQRTSPCSPRKRWSAEGGNYSRRCEFKSRLGGAVVWRARSRQSDSFQRYSGKAIDYYGQPHLASASSTPASSQLRWLELTQEDLEVDQRPKDPLVILSAFEMLAKELAELGSVADARDM